MWCMQEQIISKYSVEEKKKKRESWQNMLKQQIGNLPVNMEGSAAQPVQQC